MRLKSTVDFMAFLKKTRDCEGAVLLKTSNGDTLNLRSALCQMIAIVTIKKLRKADDVEIWCENDKDYLLLNDYLSQ